MYSISTLLLSIFAIHIFVLWNLFQARVFSLQQKPAKFVGGIMQNVTAMIGETVEFRCRIENAAFFRDNTPPKLIAYDTSVFRRTDKYELAGKANGSDHWVLRIKDVQEEDAGGYTCQINSNPILAKTAFLTLKIPPTITPESSPGAVEVREGHNVTLECHARGNPLPTIVWRRSDRQIIRYNGVNGYGDSVHRNPKLKLLRVNRKHTGEYVCVASNGIPPDETWTIKLHVLFKPSAVAQSVYAEAPQNAQEARVACNVEAWPRANVVWLLNGKELDDYHKYSIEERVDDRYKSVHTLVIRELEPNSFGTYQCVAVNDYGSDNAEIRLIEAPPYENDPIGRPVEEHKELIIDGDPEEFFRQQQQLAEEEYEDDDNYVEENKGNGDDENDYKKSTGQSLTTAKATTYFIFGGPLSTTLPTYLSTSDTVTELRRSISAMERTAVNGGRQKQSLLASLEELLELSSSTTSNRILDYVLSCNFFVLLLVANLFRNPLFY